MVITAANLMTNILLGEKEWKGVKWHGWMLENSNDKQKEEQLLSHVHESRYFTLKLSETTDV